MHELYSYLHEQRPPSFNNIPTSNRKDLLYTAPTQSVQGSNVYLLLTLLLLHVSQFLKLLVSQCELYCYLHEQKFEERFFIYYTITQFVYHFIRPLKFLFLVTSIIYN